MNALLDSVLDAALSPRCLCCHGDTGARIACDACWRELPWNREACMRCAEPLNSRVQLLCRRCATRPPPQQRALCAFRYEGTIAAWLQAFKFERRLMLARSLSEALVECLSRQAEPLPTHLIPVPLHPDRLRQRGFNQSRELARPLARRLGLRLLDDAAHRVRPTPKQSLQTGRAERRRNLRGAFAVGEAVRGRHCAILDDVITTGSTAAELAQALLHAGASRVDVWAVARTP